MVLDDRTRVSARAQWAKNWLGVHSADVALGPWLEGGRGGRGDRSGNFSGHLLTSGPTRSQGFSF